MRKAVSMSRTFCLVLAAALFAPADAEAQRRSGCCRFNPYSFSPYAGAFWDGYDAEADGSNLGWIAGFRAGYQESDRFSIHLNFGYAHTNDVATRPVEGEGVTYDNQWVITTIGGDFALVPGPTSIALGADFGVGWRKTKAAVVPPGAVAEPSDWAAYEVVAPSLTLRHRFTPRSSVFLTAQDYIFSVFDGTAQHTPVLSLGLTLR
jgi:hypothetical protein